MNNLPNIENAIEELDEFLKDLYRAECKKTTRYMILSYVLIGLLAVTMLFCGMLLFERTQYDKIVVTTTTTDNSAAYDYDVDGDNANIVNGNQYNDNAADYSGGG